MSKSHVLVPVPVEHLGYVNTLLGALLIGPDRAIGFVESIATKGAKEKPQTEAVSEPAVKEPEPEVDREALLARCIEVGTDGDPDTLWKAFDTLGSQDQEKLRMLFAALVDGARTADQLHFIDGDYLEVTWHRVKRLARACSKAGVRTPIRHSTTQGTTYVFYVGLRDGFDA